MSRNPAMSASQPQIASMQPNVAALGSLVTGFMMSRALYECVTLGVFDEIQDQCRSAEDLAPPGDQPTFAKILDLSMLVINGGCQRTEAEFCELLAEAGFEQKSVTPTQTLTETSVIEAIAV
jgi:hypothetical protein